MNTLYIIIFCIIGLLLVGLFFICFIYGQKFHKKSLEEQSDDFNFSYFKINYNNQKIYFSNKYKFFGRKWIVPLPDFLNCIISDNYLHIRQLLKTVPVNFSSSKLPIEFFANGKYKVFILKMIHYNENSNILYCALLPFQQHFDKKPGFSLDKFYQEIVASSDFKTDYVKYSINALNLLNHNKKYNYCNGFTFSINGYWRIKKYYGDTTINHYKQLILEEIKKCFKKKYCYWYLNESTLFVLNDAFVDVANIKLFIEKILNKIQNLSNDAGMPLDIKVTVGCAFLKNAKYPNLTKIEKNAHIALKIALSQNKDWYLIDIKNQSPKLLYNSGIIDLKTELDQKTENFISFHKYNTIPAKQDDHFYTIHTDLSFNLLIQYDESVLFQSMDDYHNLVIEYLQHVAQDIYSYKTKRNISNMKVIISINIGLFQALPAKIVNTIINKLKNSDIQVIFALREYLSYSPAKIKTLIDLYSSKYITFAFDNVKMYVNLKQLLLFTNVKYIIYSSQLIRKFNASQPINLGYKQQINFYNYLNELSAFKDFCQRSNIYSFQKHKLPNKEHYMSDLVDYNIL